MPRTTAVQVKVDFGHLCRFGWATQRASFNLGTDGFGYGFGGTAMKSNGSFEKYGETFTTGDRVGCLLDLVKVSAAGGCHTTVCRQQ